MRNKNGGSKGGGVKTPIGEIEQFIKKHYELRFNVVTRQNELYVLGDWRVMTDRHENGILRELLHCNIRCSMGMLQAILNSNFVSYVNPLKGYFEGLGEWSGEVDHIGVLADTVRTTNRGDWQYFFKKWIVAMAGSAVNESVINQTAIVLTGGQGSGKTTWLESVIPHSLRRYIYRGTLKPGSDDSRLCLATKLLINLDELENMQHQIGELKELITLREITIRRKFQRHFENMPRYASFAGSVNYSQFLNDITGSRRFLCFETMEIDYKHEVNLDEVFGQAMTLYRNGFQYWLDGEDIARVTVQNEAYSISSIEEETLRMVFDPVGEGEQGFEVASTTQLATEICRITGVSLNNAMVKRVGHLLKKLGYQTIKRGDRQVYKIRRKHD